MAKSHGSGSPGPFDRNTPSGFNARTSFADNFAGTTVTLHPLEVSILKIFLFIPKS